MKTPPPLFLLVVDFSKSANYAPCHWLCAYPFASFPSRSTEPWQGAPLLSPMNKLARVRVDLHAAALSPRRRSHPSSMTRVVGNAHGTRSARYQGNAWHEGGARACNNNTSWSSSSARLTTRFVHLVLELGVPCTCPPPLLPY